MECKQALALEQETCSKANACLHSIDMHLVISVFSSTDNFHITHLRLSKVAFLCCGPTTLIKQVLIRGYERNYKFHKHDDELPWRG